jgi:hypothetical protein
LHPAPEHAVDGDIPSRGRNFWRMGMPNRASQLLGRAIIVRVLAPLGANTTVKSGFDEKDVAAPC